jgi:hypothetical protein
MYGLTIESVRRAAYQVAAMNDIACPFNLEKKLAGATWYYGLMERHPKLSLRLSEATSMARIKGFYRFSVTRFFLMSFMSLFQ